MPLAGIVNNAGVGYRSQLAHMDMAEVRKAFEVNVFGVLALVRCDAQAQPVIHSHITTHVTSREGHALQYLASSLAPSTPYPTTRCPLPLCTPKRQTKAFEPLLARPGGRIVNTGSFSGLIGKLGTSNAHCTLSTSTLTHLRLYTRTPVQRWPAGFLMLPPSMRSRVSAIRGGVS